ACRRAASPPPPAPDPGSDRPRSPSRPPWPPRASRASGRARTVPRWGRGTCGGDRSGAGAGARPRRRGRWLSSPAPRDRVAEAAQGPAKPVPDLLGRVGDAWRRLLLRGDLGEDERWAAPAHGGGGRVTQRVRPRHRGRRAIAGGGGQGIEARVGGRRTPGSRGG